ncbi:MAG TPA: zinc metallopeptidase [Candidatus Latescibacteria bacterium]|nr:zinc metallopeptidase [Candidatus Latescibacterota bacterium]HOS64201.1 zinc metallopeptidase [Candidatus Latescibacterota bacterium]HOT35404.1 zinc metallopeptidase [Candidatus Latescibacterota bacterium]HPC43572.1 zinc metallopeptidase [Candidatus Latescibacterota bacterium]HPK74814.1 zinc metallopeptidase [Candidatus Latescibacterota bacterium]
MFPFFFDPTMLLLLPALAFAIWAQWKVSSTFNRYSRIPSRSRLTGRAVATQILRQNMLNDVEVGHVSGHLSDHYDPTSKTVNLSDSNYASYSVASLAVAAHEVGHALQHAHGYQPVTWRSRLVPVANIGSTAAFPLFFIGLLFGKGLGLFFMDLGIALFLFALLFHIVTLPVEFNASKRALAILEDSGMLAADEIPGAKAVLRAAALTYVASATMALMNLLRLIILRNAMSRD